MDVRIGVTLPHFGRVATVDRVVGGARDLEAGGVDSVWVRDHLSFTPHDYEPPGTRFLDPFTTLAAIAHTTDRLQLGTATLIPFRHPLVVSQLLGGIDHLAGGGRLQVGVGAGGVRRPFESTGQDFERRFEIVEDWIRALRQSWSGESVSHDGPHYPYRDVTIDPRPLSTTPIWYGGASRAAVRRAVTVADGWLPGRCPRRVFDRLLGDLRERAAAADRHVQVGLMPLTVIDRDRRTALASFDSDALVRSAAANPVWRESFTHPDDLAGMLLAGSPEECAAQALELVDLGVEHLVFDFRLRPEAIDEQLEVFASTVLPLLRAEVGAPSSRSGA